MKNRWGIIGWLVVGILLCLNTRQCHRGIGTLPDGSIIIDTLIVYDTVRVSVPVPRDSIVIRYLTVRLPVDDTAVEPETVESVPKQADSVLKHSVSVPKDSVSVTLPITQVRYETPEYRAYVSGYRPTLDSLFLFQQTKIVTVQAKPKRWSIGLQVGYGVTVSNTPQFAPYIGVGVSYNIFNF